MKEVCSSSLRSDRAGGNKLNGVSTRKKERDLEFRLTEQVYMLCCCSTHFSDDEFIWHERQQRSMY